MVDKEFILKFKNECIFILTRIKKAGIMLKITPYEREAHYYETDQMAIIHHSNYIRWFEEARTDYMEKWFSYEYLEEEGVMIPVLEVGCTYKSMKFALVILL